MFKYNRYFQAVALSLSFAFATFIPKGVAQSFAIKNYTVADGLPSGSVQTLFADSHGYLWLSTFTDLYRYDGSSFTKFSADNGFTATSGGISFEDSNGGLWGAATNSGVLCALHYSEGEFSFLNFGKNDSAGFIFSFFETRAHKILLCTGRGIFEVDGNQLKKITLGIDPSTTVRNIIELKDHSLLICTPRFIFKKYPKGRVDTIADCIVSGCMSFINVIKADDKIYVTGYNRLFYFDNERLIPFGDAILNHQLISCSIVDHQGRIFAGGTETGVIVFDHGKELTIGSVNKLSPGFISAICEDREGNIWIGDLGLTRLRPSFIDHFTTENGMQNDDTRSVFRDHSGKMYFGGNGYGFSVWNNEKFIPSTQLLSQNQLKKLEDHIQLFWDEDEENRIWMMLHSNKILLLNEAQLTDVSAQFNPTGKRVGQFAFDETDSTMYIAGDSLRLIKHDRIVATIPTTIEGAADRPYTLCFDHKHRLWIGTTGKRIGYLDLSKPLSAGLTPLFHFTKTQLPGVPIHEIKCAPDGSIWLATTGKGVLHLVTDDKGNIKQLGTITEKDGLKSTVITDLIVNREEWLWVISVDGITRFKLKSDEEGDKILASQSFGIDDGINPKSYVDAHINLDQTGNIWISTYSGAYRFRTGNIFSDSLPPKVQVEGVNILNDSSGGKNFANSLSGYFHLPLNPALPFNRNTLTIDFNTIAFTNRDELECEYKLEGLQHDWVRSQPKGTASFANLPAGKYVFHVRARRRNFSWSDEATYSFSVLAPFWQTWWFYLLCLAAITSLLYLAYRIRIDRLLAVERARIRIARDLHDDIGSTLTSISYFSEAAKMQLKNKDETGGETMLNKIGDSSRSMISSMNDIVWAINPKNDQLEDLIARMKHYASETFGQRDLPFNFLVKGNINDVRLKMEIRKNFFLVFKEAIHNIVKYARCKTVEILIEHHHQQLILIVKDDGIGFEKGEVTGEGNGMQNMQQRANEIAAQLKIDSAKGKGTRIQLESRIT